MKVKLDMGAYAPTRAHPTDAGLDLYSPKDVIVPAGGSVLIDTGVHVQLPHGTVGMVTSRSGLMKKGLTTRGTIDEPYRGSIGVVLFNHSSEDYVVMSGDRIAQLVIMPCVKPPIRLVDELDESDRAGKGFGSTGR